MGKVKKVWDIIIIGAGPAGSTAAYYLSRQGYSVLLLEKEDSPGLKKACGGLGLPDLKDTLCLPRAVCEKELNRINFSIGKKEKVYSAPHPLCLSFRRREFDGFLARRAVGTGTRLLGGSRVLSSRTGEVTVLSGENNHESTFKAKIIIYADGIPTRAWKDREIGFSPKDPFTRSLVYEVAAPGNQIDTVYYHLSPDDLPFGCIWIFPKRDLINVGAAQLNGSPGKQLRNMLDRFCRGHPFIAGREIVSRRAGLIPNRRASRIHGDNCLVVGDAGGLVDPVTGAGIHNAISSGALAAKACRVALERERYDAGTLSIYPRMWRRSSEAHWIWFWELIFRLIPFLNSRLSRESFARILRMNIFLSLRIYRLKVFLPRFRRPERSPSVRHR